MPAAIGYQGDTSESNDVILDAVFKKLEANPDHSDSWRMLGKIFLKRGRLDNAQKAFDQAIVFMPTNAAAHFDLGMMLSESGRDDLAQVHFQKVYELAPESEYACRLLAIGFKPLEMGTKPPAESGSSGGAVFIGVDEIATIDPELAEKSVQQANFEIQTFDGADDLARRIDQLSSSEEIFVGKTWRFSGETGVLYNSNVTLTPISRELASNSESSAQWIANGELEWSAWKNANARFGPIGRGYFTTNESQHRSLNLASWQAGSFFERNLAIADQPWVSRLEYMFSNDQLGGVTIGDRHSLTASMTKINLPTDITYLYAILASTQFVDDGATPSTTSLDGNSYTIGASRFYLTNWARLPSWNVGLDFEAADTEGVDYRYYSVRTHGDTTIALANRWTFVSSTGLGFRVFPEFTGTISRDDLTLRQAGKLQFQLNPQASFALVVNYDRFISDNDAFDLSKFTTGIITTIRY